MRPGHIRASAIAWLLWLPALAAAALHHDLVVSVDPDQHRIEVQDTISVGDDAIRSVQFALHPALEVEVRDTGVRLVELSAAASGRATAEREVLVPRLYRVELARGQQRFTLRYAGRILHALQQQGEEYARSFSETPGMIAPQGVFLSASSVWYPQVPDRLVSFDMRLQLPPGWRSMSQGERVAAETAVVGVEERWRCADPQEEIYLLAGRFTEYRKRGDSVEALVLLREPDAALAQQYLDATETYVKLYSELIGPYPYSKFALVENFWETGYGMPSFTLLGSKVIRFPFILHSSYPHEIVHNWWGNGVYVDYGSGNWAEGLTSYLADHLIKEQRGQGVEYRRTTLQKYTDYVRSEKDFPLTAFRGRHSASSEAVGYGKTLMLFHMLRRQLGDARFIEGLRALYREYRFRVADFDAVQRVLSGATEQPLEAFFEQWVERQGAPALQVSEPRVQVVGGDHVLSALIEQIQDGPAYDLRVPVAVQLQGQSDAWQSEVRLQQKRSRVELTLPAAPLALAVDPEFDVFRRLHRAEIPPAVSQAMGAQQVLIVLPSQAPAALLEAYRGLAESWRVGNPGAVAIASDAELKTLPADRAVWLFGWRNRFRASLAEALDGYPFAEHGDSVRIEQTRLTKQVNPVVVMARQPSNPDQALGWLAAEQPAALAGLGRKLPHYGRYSYLGFSGEAPDNVLKGQWPVVDSPMSVRLVDDPGAAGELAPLRLAPRRPLVAAAERFSRARLQRDVEALGSKAMAGRGLDSPELERAADYIANQFHAAGLQPGGDDAHPWFQAWEQRVEVLDASVILKNVIGLLPGSDPRLAGESLVIGAHYDHFGRGAYVDHAAERGKLHPGADDNASGVAVMLELARVLARQPPPRSVVFVAFSGEETGRLGSRHYVQKARAYPADKIIAMLNLDTVGRLGENPVTVFGTGSADEWAHIFRGASHVTGVGVKPVDDDFGSSDQSSFIAAGIPAVQLFGSLHADIHRPGDTLDKIDVSGLVKVTALLNEAALYLAGRPQPLTSTLGGVPESAPAAVPGKRRVSLGTVPDFGFSGPGVRLEDVRAGAPAAQAGLQAGDVIIAVNDGAVGDMRDYAAALRRLQPGDEIRVRFRRAGAEQTVTTRVVER
jgi:aminopeptidase N